MTILHYLGALDSQLTRTCANASEFLPISGRPQEKRRLTYDHFIQFRAQLLSIPKKPLRESGSELGAGDVVLASIICFLSSLSRRHSAGVVEEKVMGTTILGEVCHQV